MRSRSLSLWAGTLLLSAAAMTSQAAATGSNHHNTTVVVVNGTNGQNGQNGANGANGQNGANGLNGQNGTNGQNGANGLNGQNGTNGQNGANGLNGQNGANGQNGQNGQNGESGQNGQDGRDGRDGRVTDIPVATAYAAPVIATEDTCMGSSSVGAQAMAFGVSVGTTWRDSNCQRLKNSRELAAMGFDRAAVALLCVDDDVRDAMTTAGTPCPALQTQANEEPEPRRRSGLASIFH